MKELWSRNKRLAAIVAERGLSVSGFRRSLRKLAEEFFPGEDDAECGLNEWLTYTLEEWLGDYSPVPAAYRIVRSDQEGIYGVTVEVYEVEGTAELPEWKIAYYGNCADCDGPNFDLHILDRYDHEVIVESADLMRFMSLPYWSADDKKKELKWLRSRAVAQHHAPVVVELGVDVLQDVIYGLGLGQPHKTIALRTGLSPEMVKTVAGLLATNSVNPKGIVKDAHARWKAAYDAVRELGVQL
jgi:hypothetical protein